MNGFWFEKRSEISGSSWLSETGRLRKSVKFRKGYEKSVAKGKILGIFLYGFTIFKYGDF